MEYFYKKDDFNDFINILKKLNLYNVFKNSDSLKKSYNSKILFQTFLKELSPDLYQLSFNIIDLQKVFNIWNEFFLIYISVKDNCYNGNEKVNLVSEQCFNWLKLFQSKYTPCRITPYEHAFGEHLGEMIERFGDVNLFNMQGLEKLNHLTTMHYFNSTNKHDDFLIQLIKKRNRLEICHFIYTYNWNNWKEELNHKN